MSSSWLSRLRLYFRVYITCNFSTIINSSTLQNYLRTIYNRGEITSDVYSEVQPQSTQPARAHGFPKTHKDFDTLPPFRPIIDTTGTAYQPIAKYLTRVLNPLTMNAYTLKDSFEAVSRIQNIPVNLFRDGYRFVSFDVKSLFTNVPLKKTINIILDRIYNKKEINTTLKKRTLKKLLLDCCTKTPFSINGELFKQTDGVAMGSPLGPTLANIIMTTFEDEIVRQLIDSNVIKFYARYVDDTLVLAKPSDIPIILQAFNSFHPQIQFTFEDFPDNNVHFLDLKINSRDITIFRKSTHTGQYTHLSSFVPWSRKTAWIRALINRAYKICNNDQLLKLELKTIRDFMSWNGFSRNLTKKLINAFTPNPEGSNNIPHGDLTERATPDNLPKIWIRLPFIGRYGNILTKKFVNKTRRLLKSPCKFILNWRTTNSNCFLSCKDKTPDEYKNSVVYEFSCPGCRSTYIGKTDRCLYTRLKEHSTRENSEINAHINHCEHFQHIKSLMELSPDSTNPINTNLTELIFRNCKIIDRSDHWSLLLFKESLAIRRRKPDLNHGAKASKELIIFH